MLRWSLLLCLAMLAGTGCIRSKTEASIQNDASGTATYDSAYKLESLEAAKERMEEARARFAERGGEDGQFNGDEQLAKFLESFDPDHITATLKAKGYEVKSAKAYEREGWKGVTVEATFKDVNDILAKARAEREAARAEREAEMAKAEAEGGDGDRPRRGRGMAMRGRMNPSGANSIGMVTAFEKTSDPKVGKAVLTLPADAGRGGRGGGGGGRGGRGGRMGGGDMPGADEQRRTLKITLPGKIVETSHCKTEGENTVILDLRQADTQPDEDGNAPAVVREGAWVRFEIPESCAIRFDDPAAAKKPTEKPAEGEAEGEKPKRGGLRIGGN